MLVINSIEKSRLSADSFSYSGGGVAWKARFVLFLGFALLAGGLAGSVVSLFPYNSLFYSSCKQRQVG
jgi:TRAP-type mannitol/chloroaromatic compound transport system permease small subunit